MASTSPSTPATWSFDLAGQLKRKLGVGPQNWDRFSAAGQAAGEPAPYVPPSGAHVTLKDLARDPRTIAFPSNDDPAVRAALEDDGGWVGTPDPTKYAPDTEHLSPKELQEEVDKGNIMLWKDFKQCMAEVEGEELEAVEAIVRKRVAQERMFFTLEDGSKVSLWDLQQYVYNNPELKALYERGRNVPVADPNDPAGRLLPSGPVSGLELSKGQEVAVMAPEEANELELDWGHVASGSLWRRRPTRWLRGLDGVKDWDMEVYVHEPLANQVLGRKYGGRDPHSVVKEADYARDVARCGPLLGMTFVLTAAREMPLQEVASTWRNLLASHLQRQAPLVVPRRLRPNEEDPTDLNGASWTKLFTRSRAEVAAEAVAAGVDELGVSWRTQEAAEHRESVQDGSDLLKELPEALCPGPEPAAWPLTGTSLVNGAGTKWRQGGALWVTLEPEGGVVLQAQSAGRIGDQESFWLGRVVEQEALCGAVMDAFLGPQPIDEDMAAAARAMLLLPANGFTSGNKERDPNHPLWPAHTGVPAWAPSGSNTFRLGQTPTLVAGIRDGRLEGEVQGLLERASAAAADAEAAEPGPASASATDAATVEAARRLRGQEAAAEVLREGLQKLGPEAAGVFQRTLSYIASPSGAGMVPVKGRSSALGASDLFSLARSLDGEQDA